MTLPTVHLNGTSAKDLYADLERAYDAIQVAWEVLRRAAPNGRDYYPQGPRVVYQAEDEHVSRLQRLQSVQQELELLMEHVGKNL